MSDRDATVEPRRIGVREFRGNMASYLRQARLGTSFLLMSRDEVLAEIRPPSAAARPVRRPGSLRGRIVMADDFDETPVDLLEAIEAPLE